MKYRTLQQPATIAYSASNTVQLVLNALNFWPTAFLLDLELAKTDAGSPAANQDWLWRAITALSITGNGRQYVSCAGLDLRPMYWDTRLKTRGRYRAPDWVAGSRTFRHMLPLILSPDPVAADDGINWYDSRIAIDPTSDLTISVTWGANSVTGANTTVGTGTLLRVTPVGVVMDRGERPTHYPEFRTPVASPTQTYSGKGYTINLDPGYFYASSTLMLLNGSPNSDNRNDGLAGAAISEIGFFDYNGNPLLDAKVWDWTQQHQGSFLVADDNAAVPGATLAGGASVSSATYNPGVGLVDYRRVLDNTPVNDSMGNPIGPDPTFGLNGNGKQAGFAKFGLTVDTATNTKVAFFHRAYQRR